MMDNILIRYFNQRVEQAQAEAGIVRKGPVVTISRQAGCPAGVVSEYLLKRLKDERFGPDPAHWRIINKEILSEAARELGLSEDKINYIIEIGMRSTMEEIIAALSSKYYKSDRKIRKTVAEVIRTIAASGSVIDRAMAACIRSSSSGLQ